MLLIIELLASNDRRWYYMWSTDCSANDPVRDTDGKQHFGASKLDIIIHKKEYSKSEIHPHMIN